MIRWSSSFRRRRRWPSVRLPGLTEKISHMLAEIRSLHAENESLKSKVAKDAMGDITDRMQQVGDLSFLAVAVPDVDMNGLRDLGDDLKAKWEKALWFWLPPRTARSA